MPVPSNVPKGLVILNEKEVLKLAAFIVEEVNALPDCANKAPVRFRTFLSEVLAVPALPLRVRPEVLEKLLNVMVEADAMPAKKIPITPRIKTVAFVVVMYSPFPPKISVYIAIDVPEYMILIIWIYSRMRRQ
jgi:hypothetical protein